MESTLGIASAPQSPQNPKTRMWKVPAELGVKRRPKRLLVRPGYDTWFGLTPYPALVQPKFRAYAEGPFCGIWAFLFAEDNRAEEATGAMTTL
jgi:hypothetical protein